MILLQRAERFSQIKKDGYNAMKKRILSIVLAVLILMLPLGLTAAAKTTAADTPRLVAAKIPTRQWQLDVTFPDWKGSINTSFAVNNRVGFYGYAGQGTLYLQPDKQCGAVLLFIAFWNLFR